MKNSEIFNKLKKYILKNKFHSSSISKILIKENVSEKDYYLYFNKDIGSLINYFFDDINEKIVFDIENNIPKEKSISKRVLYCIKREFYYLEENRDVTKAFLNYLIIHPFKFKKISVKFSNFVWMKIADESTDFNYYTKRLILSKIFFNSVMFWRNSDNILETNSFIEKQINLLGKFGKLKGSMMKSIKPRLSFEFLTKFDFLHKQ